MKTLMTLSLLIVSSMMLSGCATNSGVNFLQDEQMSLKGHDLATMDGSRRIIMSKKVDDESIYCAEPYPDFGHNVDSQLTGNLGLNMPQSIGGNFTLTLDDKFKTEIQSVYSRNQTIQYLRDSIYRLCEAAANGLISRGVYESLLTKTMAFTTSFLSMEMIKDTEDPERILALGEQMLAAMQEDKAKDIVREAAKEADSVIEKIR